MDEQRVTAIRRNLKIARLAVKYATELAKQEGAEETRRCGQLAIDVIEDMYASNEQVDTKLQLMEQAGQLRVVPTPWRKR